MIARMYVDPAVEPMFCEDSYGYRPNKSALEAIAVTRKRCWRYDYVIELDVKELFCDGISERELAREYGISQPAIHKKKQKILYKIKLMLET